MQINGVEIEETFAEAFVMWGARAIITADSLAWAFTAGQAATGFATSIIGCGCEAGLEREWSADETPDGRPGVSILLFARTPEELAGQLVGRVGQCVMTSATSACYNGLEGSEWVPVGGKLRYFGDGFQTSKRLGARRLWRLPVMEGEFVVEDRFGLVQGVGGGNFLILAESAAAALAAAEAAVAAIRGMPGVILPFPGGIVRSGSKVGSRYRFLRASSNTPYCPTLRGRVETALPEGANAALEIVVDGLDEAAVRRATRAGVLAACRPGVLRISAGNYGGRLGRHHFHLHRILEEP